MRRVRGAALAVVSATATLLVGAVPAAGTTLRPAAAAAGTAGTGHGDASDAPAAGAPRIRLVTEAEPPGPEPADPNASGNPAAPRNYDANFLWGAAAGLLVRTVLGVAGLAGLYYLLVVRPGRRADAE